MNMNWLNNLELRQIYLIIGSVCFLALTAQVMLIGKPAWDRYQSASQDLETLRALDLNKGVDGLSQLQVEVDELESRLLGDLEGVPTRELETHIISALQSAAWQSEIKLVSIEPLPRSEDLPYEEIAFRLELEGAYFNLDSWVSRVYNQLGYVVFQDYALKVHKAGDEPVLSARLLLAAYRMEANS